jgi:hypothetical protein
MYDVFHLHGASCANSGPHLAGRRQTGQARCSLTARDRDSSQRTTRDEPRTGTLYDLVKDPGEFNDLWNNSGVKDAQEMMFEKIAPRMIETTDPLPEPHPTW